MAARVERTFELDAPPETVWEFIADPANRAAAISVVEDYEIDGTSAVWHIRIPVPLIRRTVRVETRDVERDPPRFVRFVGRSKAMRVSGEHEVAAMDGGSRLRNLFVVEGRIPGVETFFRRNLDDELGNLERNLNAYIDDR
ncbi:CoxG family protein [Halobacteriaceae archaeon GCM10025711]